MDVRIADVLHDAVPYSLPLTRPFRGLTEREGVLLRGPSGWGEFAPFADYTPEQAARWLACAVESAFGTWPTPLRQRIPVNAIIPAVSATQAAEMARTAVLDHGCSTIKIKVAAAGETLADDESRVVSVRDAADSAMLSTGSSAKVHLRLDANGGWDLATAERALRRLAAYRLQYVEQPCRSPEDLRELRAQVEVPIAVDEGVRVDSLSGVQLRDIADVIIVKAGPLGGVRAAQKLAEDVGLPVVVSGGLDSAVGLSAGTALAAVLDAPADTARWGDGSQWASGLGTGALLEADVVRPVRVPVDGHLEVGRVSPDLDALMRARERLSDDRAKQWRQRVVDAWLAGGESLIEQLDN
ncbi:MAG: o-succinylbenzoate synthase [Candidatus Nanopelagicales bacterium]